MNTDVGVILPTFCEAENIEKIVHKIVNLRLNLVLLIIDDSSPDETPNIIKRLKGEYENIIVLNRPFKKGLGTAITDGFRLLLSQSSPPKYIITMDADFSHNPEDIPKLIARTKEGYDMVIGSRYCEGGEVRGWSLTRWSISRIANKLAKSVLKLPINDFTNGFRCYSIGFVQKILPKLHSQTYEIQIETIRQAKLQHLKVGDTAIIFENRKKGKSTWPT